MGDFKNSASHSTMVASPFLLTFDPTFFLLVLLKQRAFKIAL
jgi:hypothetical protein